MIVIAVQVVQKQDGCIYVMSCLAQCLLCFPVEVLCSRIMRMTCAEAEALLVVCAGIERCIGDPIAWASRTALSCNHARITVGIVGQDPLFGIPLHHLILCMTTLIALLPPRIGLHSAQRTPSACGSKQARPTVTSTTLPASIRPGATRLHCSSNHREDRAHRSASPEPSLASLGCTFAEFRPLDVFYFMTTARGTTAARIVPTSST